MFKLRFATLSLLIPLLPLTTFDANAAPIPSAMAAEAQLRAINHRFVNAFAVPDYEFMEKLTASDFFMIGNNGDWIDRARHLDAMKKAAITGGVSYDDLRVRLFGRVALVHGWFEANALANAPIRVRYTDVYFWNGETWQLVSAQNTPVREGASKATQLGTTPKIEAWKGSDPKGDETSVLRELNENYVRAFRETDVAWYDAHLAPDYIVISSDGSLNDRAKALENFAKPVFATQMKSFPVSDVRIRRFDDVAIIHAENSYELKDGRKGVSRYTDIWWKTPEGRWMCIAAHINTFKPPM